MPCLLGCLALSAPRFVLFLVWLFTDYLGRAIESNLMMFLGFLFLPMTTLAYAWAKNSSPNHSVEGIYLAAVIFAVLIDLGILNFGRGGRWGGGKGSGPASSGGRDITVSGQRVR